MPDGDDSIIGSSSPRGERINRFLSRSGVGSRRKAEDLILAGRVTINGEIINELATFVKPNRDRVAVDGKPMIPPAEEPVWIILNKTADALSARRDGRGRSTIFDLLPEEYARLIPVGRLDLDTEGVLLLTNDGESANRLMHPRYEVERVYEAVVDGTPTLDKLRSLYDGIDLGDPTPAHAKAKIVTRHRTGAVVQVTIREGRKREVKRLFEAIGHKVLRLRRLSFAGITARGVAPGQWRKLTEAEIEHLTQRPDPPETPEQSEPPEPDV